MKLSRVLTACLLAAPGEIAKTFAERNGPALLNAIEAVK
jgi:hypothetical protein